ncbi:hypothetical protein XELAEV_18008573mg [Xenopus laevis]|uniref:Uncharacterized protein n=1 Tax=Xenopus laevis TaxID=8355 RepID=A0A974E3V8_XENLA|nr:hypothetical protein XELAEV_18008573mg [Xenopus laevis]
MQLQKEMAEMKSLFIDVFGNRANTSKGLETMQRTLKPSREACKAANLQQICYHWFKCARGCRVVKQHSGNRWRLLQKDMQ